MLDFYPGTPESIDITMRIYYNEVMRDTYHIDDPQRQLIADALRAYSTLYLGQTDSDKQLAAKLEFEFRNPKMKVGSLP